MLLDELQSRLKVLRDRLDHVGVQLHQEHAVDLPGMTVADLFHCLAKFQDRLTKLDARLAKDLIECNRPLFRQAERAEKAETTEQTEAQAQAGAKSNGRKSREGK